MKLRLYNITHQNCPVEAREKASFTEEQRISMLAKMRAEDNIREAVILETCNRTEFYIYVKKEFDCARFLEGLIRQTKPQVNQCWNRYYQEVEGTDAVRHLFEVAAGLNSQMLGENQILSQVKAAYTLSHENLMSGFLFHRLFHIAFRVGKAVRTLTNINCGAVSVALAAVDMARKKVDLPSSRVMVIGAGENAALVAKYLVKSAPAELVIANRSVQRARTLCKLLKKGHAMSLNKVKEYLSDVDLVISSATCDEPVIKYKEVAGILKKRKKPLVIIDIAVPRDIAPSVGKIKCVSLFNIDDLDEQIDINKKKRSREIPKARRIVDEFTDKFANWYESLNIFPVITELTQKGVDLAHSEAKRYVRDFGKDNLGKLEVFAEALVRKVLHGPIDFIKGGGDGDNLDAERFAATELIGKMFLSKGKGNG